MRKLNVCHCDALAEAILKFGGYCERLDCFALRARNDVRGFTLAEVLITLGIIGVVAALTMPPLIASHKKKELESRFRRAQALIENALVTMRMDVGNIDEEYCGTTGKDKSDNIFIQDFAKYFQTTEVFPGSTGNLDTIGYKIEHFSQSAPGNAYFNIDSHDDGAMFLNNGMMIASSGCWWRKTMVDFVVDTNGVKGPNKFGYDVFYFQIDTDNRLAPSGTLGVFQGANLQACCNFQQENTCNVTVDTGCSCSSFAIMDEYPHDRSKRYWQSLP
ncbi:MAG: type II secretion system GspH family protein [Heliobacteriaceae bacterium]|jgi:prepilin-type N-terminal cleavage/methylation domain-containing protein|nr:type II secretion system GspH family protein [Heliobacteriaceae bacterium]